MELIVQRAHHVLAIRLCDEVLRRTSNSLRIKAALRVCLQSLGQYNEAHNIPESSIEEKIVSVSTLLLEDDHPAQKEECLLGQWGLGTDLYSISDSVEVMGDASHSILASLLSQGGGALESNPCDMNVLSEGLGYLVSLKSAYLDLEEDLVENWCLKMCKHYKKAEKVRQALPVTKLLPSDGWMYPYLLATLFESQEARRNDILSLFNYALEKCPASWRSKVAIKKIKFMYYSKSFGDAAIRLAFEECWKITDSAKLAYLFACYLDDFCTVNPTTPATYNALKACAKTFMVCEKYDRIVCCRFLSLWFQSAESSDCGEAAEKIGVLVQKVFRKAPSGKFLSCISQIAAKILSAPEKVGKHLQLFLLRILQEFPHTAIWKVMNYALSLSPARRKKYQFLPIASKAINGLGELWEEYSRLSQILIELSALKLKEAQASLSKICPRLLQFRGAIIAFPHSASFYRDSHVPVQYLFMERFEDRVEILPSLQKPRKLVIRCSDGICRTLLCKPKDDVRKDMRFLEVSSIVNTLLPEDLKIVTYTAFPLDEETGLIEWIDNTISMRAILVHYLRQSGTTFHFPGFRELQARPDFSLIFSNDILPR